MACLGLRVPAVCHNVSALHIPISRFPQVDAAAASDATVVAFSQPNVPANRVVSKCTQCME